MPLTTNTTDDNHNDDAASRHAALLAAAWRSYDLRQLGEAARLAGEACALVPDNPDSRTALAWFLMEDGRHDEAERLLISTIDAHPRSAVAHWYVGLLRRQQHRLEEARAALTIALDIDPELDEAGVILAWMLHDLGDFSEATKLARKAISIRVSPERAELLGWLLLCQKQYAEAVGWLRLALLELPRRDVLRNHLATALKALGRDDEIVELLRQGLLISPENSEFLTLLGWLHFERGEFESVLPLAEKLVNMYPERATAWQFLGVIHQSLRSPVQAEHCFAEALLRDQTLIDAQFRRAVLLREMGRSQEAADVLEMAAAQGEKSIAQSPEDVRAWLTLAQIRMRQSRWQEAEHLLLTAHGIDPASAETDRDLGWVLMAMHRVEEAEAAFQRAASKDGGNPLIQLAIAEAQRRLWRYPQAWASLRKALDLHPDHPDAVLIKAKLLVDCGPAGADEAVALCSQLLQQRREVRESALLLMNLAARGEESARSALRLLDRSERERFFVEAVELAHGDRGNEFLVRLSALAVSEFPGNLELAVSAFFVSGMDESNAPEQVARHMRVSAQRLLAEYGRPPPRITGRTPCAKLRIAYLAKHLHRCLLMPVLAAHDLEQVEVFLYTDVTGDKLGELRAGITVIPVDGINLAESMAAHQIDVAVDTVGIHPFAGQFDILRQAAGRLAPVQCAWLGSLAGSGGIFDVLITDADALPAVSEPYYHESIIRLPGGQWCWEPPNDSPEPGPLPCLEKKSITFGSTVRGMRLTRRTLDAWAVLLASVPESTLELIGPYGHDWQLRQTFAGILDSRGVDPERVRYSPWREHTDYLKFFHRIDVALDTFPANGGLCLIDAIWMGVPVVTCAGVLQGERQGVSILSAVGHGEWVARNDEDYVAIALSLASNPAELSRIRQQLRQEILASPLTDGVRIARALEQTLGQEVRRIRELHGGEAGALAADVVETRFCLDPWNYLEIDPTLGLMPCCNMRALERWRPATDDMDQLRNGAAFRELRRQLLTGQLGEACRRCHIRPNVNREQLVAEVRRRYGNDMLAAGPVEMLRLEVTTACNLRCVYCRVSQPDYVAQAMPVESLASLVDMANSQPRITDILMNGHGETTFFPGWQDFCRSLAQAGRRLSITSNLARPLSVEDAQCLALFDAIQVSLDTVNARLLAQLRRRVKLSTLVGNIALIREQAALLGIKAPKIALSCGIFDKSVPGLVDLANFMVAQHVVSVTFWQLVKYSDLPGAMPVSRIPDLPASEIRASIESVEQALSILDAAGIDFELAGEFLEPWRSVAAAKENESMM